MAVGLLMACGGGSTDTMLRLQQAEDVVEEHPDSAAVLAYRSLGVDVVAGLVAQKPEQPLLLRSGYVVGVVLRGEVLFA